jgi:DNA transformation protein
MSTQPSTIDYLLEQLASAGSVSARKMFGEYGLYCDGKIVALVCDDQFFLKPTPEGRAFLGEAVDEQPAYGGASRASGLPGSAGTMRSGWANWCG